MLVIEFHKKQLNRFIVKSDKTIYRIIRKPAFLNKLCLQLH